MSGLLIIGTVAGSMLGVLHAWGVYARRTREAGAREKLTARDRLRAAYFAGWAVLLWTFFGAYVLILWLVSLPIWFASHLVSRSATPTGV
jgi:hypothetical protein